MELLLGTLTPIRFHLVQLLTASVPNILEGQEKLHPILTHHLTSNPSTTVHATLIAEYKGIKWGL